MSGSLSELSPPALVSVGIPVRNGGIELKAALRSIVRQTHENLQIIISDNASSDDTMETCRSLALADNRVEYHRQDPARTAWSNFAFTYQQARGDFFMWAAHDDTRSDDYVELLLRELNRDPAAVLAFGDLVRCYPFGQEAVPEYEFQTRGLPYRKRLKRPILSSCAEIYGLHRMDGLEAFPWEEDSDFAPDVPFLIFTSLRGEVIHVPGPVFYQGLPARPKDATSRAQTDSYSHTVGSHRFVRLCWRSGGSAVFAEHLNGRRRSRLFAFIYLYGVLRISLAKTRLYELAPTQARSIWRHMKNRRRQVEK